MRSLEFIAEKINPRVAKPDFYAEKTVDTQAGKMRLVARALGDAPRSVPQFIVNAYDERGEDVARVRFVVADYDPDPPRKWFGVIRMYPERDPYVVAGNASVRYMLQRKGIGTAIYDFVRELGNDIKPSRSQSDAGRAMWRSFRRREVAEGERAHDAIENMAQMLPGDVDDYFVRFTDQDKIGFSAKQHFGRTPDIDDPEFDPLSIRPGQGRPALWFYPLKTYLRSRHLFASDHPYVWLVRKRPDAWLQPVGRAGRGDAPSGQRRVGMLRRDGGLEIAVFFEPAFDVVDRWHEPRRALAEYSETDRGIVAALKQKGYKLLGRGVDQTAFVEPGTGYVLKVFGTQCTRRGRKPTLSADQKMFKLWAEFCAKNSNNPHLPRIYDWDTFVWNEDTYDYRSGGLTKELCMYLQIRTEPLKHVPNAYRSWLDELSQMANGHRDFNEAFKYIREYDLPSFERFIKRPDAISNLKRFYDTMKALARTGSNQGFTWDLHPGNIMQRADGTLVINDPWVI